MQLQPSGFAVTTAPKAVIGDTNQSKKTIFFAVSMAGAYLLACTSSITFVPESDTESSHIQQEQYVPTSPFKVNEDKVFEAEVIPSIFERITSLKDNFIGSVAGIGIAIGVSRQMVYAYMKDTNMPQETLAKLEVLESYSYQWNDSSDKPLGRIAKQNIMPYKTSFLDAVNNQDQNLDAIYQEIAKIANKQNHRASRQTPATGNIDYLLMS